MDGPRPRDGLARSPLPIETALPIRSLLSDQGDPWFVAVDVCKALDIGDTTSACRRLDADEKRLIDPAAGAESKTGRGGARKLTIVSESGLYALILRSDKPSAKKFRKWVTGHFLILINRR